MKINEKYIIEKPVFIIGSPRSGTTLLLDLLAAHSGFAWVSNHLNRNPSRLSWTGLNRVYDLPGIGPSLYVNKKKFKILPHPRKDNRKDKRYQILPFPVEPWRFWDAYLSNFQWKRNGPVPPRRSNEEDISIDEILNIRNIVSKVCELQGKRRFLSKYTDFPRIRYLTQAFPDAKFIHIVRDGRAQAYSYYQKMKSGEFRIWPDKDWWISGFPKEWREDFINHHNNPLALAVYLWKFFLDEIWAEAGQTPSNQYHEINYKDLVKSPDIILENVFKFCEMEVTGKIRTYIEQINLSDMNKKWQTRLTQAEKDEIEDIVTEERFRRLFDEDI